ncbi:MAG: Fic family protein [Aureispira sp.]
MKFDRTKPHNNLPLLPPPLNKVENINILKKLNTASRALAVFDGRMSRLPNPSMLVNTIALQEAKTSSEIENIFTTNDSLYKAISDSTKNKNIDPATKEVLRYREALWTGYKDLKENSMITKDLIIKIFQQIKESSATLRSPQSNVVIKKGNSEFRSGETVYTPPRGIGVLEKLLDNLIEYLNDDEKYPTDPLLKMCIAHYQFEAIHPFHDGNGRTGRILNLLYLNQKKLLSYPSLYLSKYIIRYKDEYYYKLGNVTQRGNWEKWITYMLDGIEKTALLTSSLIDEILTQMESTLQHGKKSIDWYNKEINEIIFSQPYIRYATLEEVLQIHSRTTLTKYFHQLVAAKILSYKKIGAKVFYVNDDLIRILEQ